MTFAHLEVEIASEEQLRICARVQIEQSPGGECQDTARLASSGGELASLLDPRLRLSKLQGPCANRGGSPAFDPEPRFRTRILRITRTFSTMLDYIATAKKYTDTLKFSKSSRASDVIGCDLEVLVLTKRLSGFHNQQPQKRLRRS